MSEALLKLNELFENGFLNAMISISFTIIFLLIINHILNKWIEKKLSQHAPMAKRTKRAILYTIAICVILAQFKAIGPILQTLLASGGILAVVIGLASQEAASDIINGAMIYLYKPYRIGDIIYVSEHNVKGTVLDIAIGHTVLETFEKTKVTIPNSIMNKAVIENISNVDNKKNNYLFIDIAYDSDIDKAISIIQEESMKHENFIDPRTPEEIKNKIPAVSVKCVEFKDSSVALRASIYSKDNASGVDMLSDLRITLLKRFKEENIEIPFPHQVILYKNDESAS